MVFPTNLDFWMDGGIPNYGYSFANAVWAKFGFKDIEQNNVNTCEKCAHIPTLNRHAHKVKCQIFSFVSTQENHVIARSFSWHEFWKISTAFSTIPDPDCINGGSWLAGGNFGDTFEGITVIRIMQNACQTWVLLNIQIVMLCAELLSWLTCRRSEA